LLAAGSLIAVGLVILSLTAIGALAQGCTTPTSGMVITEDTLLCAGEHSLQQGLSITASTVVLDCGGATLLGPGTTSATSGITVSADNVDVRNCVIQNFGVGLTAAGVLNLRQSGLGLAGNGQETSVVAGEEITLPSDDTPETPVTQPETPAAKNDTPPAQPPTTPPTPPVTPPAPVTPPTVPAPAKPVANTSIWLVHDVKSEALLENSLTFEHNATVSDAELTKRVGELRDFLENIEVERQFIYRGGQTIVKITLKPKSGFFRRVIYDNITLYEYIPKCFQQLVDGVVFDTGQPQVLDPDPLVKKVLGKGELSMQYHAPVVVSPQCQQLFRVIGLGQGKQVKTLGSVLADEGIFAVVRVFPTESLTVLIFIVLLGATALWYKHEIDRVG
jgi:hypothetical protein